LAENDRDRSIAAEGLARYFADVKAVDGWTEHRIRPHLRLLGTERLGQDHHREDAHYHPRSHGGDRPGGGFDVVKEQDQVRERIGVALQESVSMRS